MLPRGLWAAGSRQAMGACVHNGVHRQIKGTSEAVISVYLGELMAGIPAAWVRASCFPYEKEENGGEGGIRTLGTGFNQYNGLANRRFRPLSHLTVGRTRESYTPVAWGTSPQVGPRGLPTMGPAGRAQAERGAAD